MQAKSVIFVTYNGIHGTYKIHLICKTKKID